MEEPIVYIVLPVYNGGDLFKQQLYTIVKQYYKNWNLIIINDGSTDNTQDIISDFIAKYDISNKVTVINQENSGQYAACGVGLDYIRKQLNGNYDNIYISYCDADDLWALNKLEIQVEYMRNNPECDLSYHDCWLIDDKNEIIGESAIMYFCTVCCPVIMKRFLDVGVGHSAISTEMMFKAKFIDEILPVPDFMSQDWWVSICIIATEGNVNKIDKHLGYYRLHNSSSLHRKRKKILFEKRQYDTFLYLKNNKSHGGKRDKVKDLDYVIEYRKTMLNFRNNKKCFLVRIMTMISKFPRILILYVKNYLQIIKFRTQLYKNGFKKRLKLHHIG